MQKETIYEWQDSMAACFRGSLIKCNEFANQCVKEGWVRVNDTMTHPNHGQVLNLVQIRFDNETGRFIDTPEEVAARKAKCKAMEAQVDFDLLKVTINRFKQNEVTDVDSDFNITEEENLNKFFELEEVKKIIERN